MMTSHEIRQAFLEYFQSKGHEVVASGPIVPQNDPTLMFVNAGMVPFKDVFTGREKRDYRRATSCQKCIRISGKHNDLENVGVTARHHTFFEMLGNFSFGDYFKAEAVKYAWELVTEVLKIPKERLVVTYFEGAEGIPADEECRKLWEEISGLPPGRIQGWGLSDNFWQMGETGPCGPSSEIFYYIGDAEDPGDPRKMGQEPGDDGAGWVELWNLVFMQFERLADGRLEPLPAPSIDTGAGLERLCCVLQGVRSNYDTDLLRPIAELAAEIAGKTYTGSDSDDDMSMRVIADHARTTAFMIAEGIFPDREGRSYVLRRVMRRAIRHGHRLGIETPFLHRCALRCVEIMGDHYGELVERKALIADIAEQEEKRFRATLARGLDLLAENEAWSERDGSRLLPGQVAFKLYDTYGFPLDLQDVIGEEQGFVVDHAGFEAEMARAKERSQGSKVGDKQIEGAYLKLVERLGKTEFLGYECELSDGEIAALLRDGEEVERASEGDEVEIVSPRTPFYAESGGQVGDRGVVRTATGEVQVRDTQKPAEGLWVHRGVVARGTLQLRQKAELSVDAEARAATRRNHSATHLLHFALRTVLGAQAMQKGSLVAPDRLRFDYSGTRPLTPDEIRRIEDLVNERIVANHPISTDVLPIDEAKSRGAIGIFEEKYGATVRMLTISPDSIELCGGTHASRTGDIGLFKILGDSGLAAGVRRIEAATGLNAVQHVRGLDAELERAGALLKTSPLQVAEGVERLLASQKEQRREMEQLKQKLLRGGSGDLTAEARDAGDYRALGAVVDVPDVDAMRALADQLRDKLAPAVVLLGAELKSGKVSLVCTVSKDLTKRFQAGKLVKEAAQVVGGGGGGRPDFAQAGGSDASKLGEAVSRLYELVGC